MDENLQKLYESLSSRGYYTKSFEDFQKQYQDPAYQDKVYGVVTRDGLYTKDKDSFIAKYSPSEAVMPQEDLKKKDQAVSTELPSDVTPLASSSEPKTDLEIATAKARGEYIPPSGTLQEQIKAAGQAAMGDSYMGGSIPYERTDVAKKTEEKKFKEIFDTQTKSKQDFDESLGQVNQDLTAKDEEFIVPRLEYLFGNYGFKFDQSGVGYDAINVTAPNGESKTISVDMFTDKGDIASSNELRDFINKNKPKIEAETSPIKKYKTEEEVNLVTKRINDSNQQLNDNLNSLKDEMDAFNIAREYYKKNVNDPDFFETATLLDQKAANIIRRNEELSAKSAEINVNQSEIQRLTGYYIKAKAQEGGIFRASYNAALKSIGSVGAGLFDFLLKVSPLSAGAEPYQKEVKEAQKVIREGLVNVAGAEVSKEYMEAAQEDFLKRNVIGAAGFVPILAAAAAQPQLAMPLFFSTAYDAANEEMDSNPAFEKLSSTEKTAVATTLGIVNAVLLKYNATNTFLASNTGKKFVASVLEKMGSKTSAKTVQEFVENEVQGGIKKGVIQTVAGGAHGFTTGMELMIGEKAIKTTYNLMKDEKMFEVPTKEREEGDTRPEGTFDIKDIDFNGYAKEIVEGGIDMAMGAALLGSLNTIRTARKENNYKGVTDNDVAMFEAFAADNNLRTLDIQNVKSELLKKNYDEYRQKGMTSANAYEAAKKDVQDLNDAVGIFNSMPSDLSTAGKRKAFGLLSERTTLEKKIEGKDKSLVKKETDRIAEINKDLEDLSTAQKPKEDAIQEQAAGQVPVQPTAGGRQEVAQGEPQAEPQVAPQEGQAEEVIAGEPTDANYAVAQEVNNNVAKANPEASVLLTAKGDDLSLTAVYVGKEKRGKGIGTKVLETVKAEADRTGKKIVLDATNELDADTNLDRLNAFYEKNGFKKVGENKFEYDPKESKAKAEEIKPAKETVDFSADEIEALKEDIGKIEEQGTLSDNVGEKVYIGNEEGNIKIEGQQYVFESNTTIKELGNVNEVGGSFLASFGISKFPSEGVKAEKRAEGKKPNIVTIEGKEYTFLRSRKPEGGKAVVVVKDNETGLQRVIKGDAAEKTLKDISLQKPVAEIKLELQTEGKPVVERTKEELKREARAERKKAREEFEAKSLEELTQMQERLDKEAAKFESDLLETIAKESKKESRLLVASDGKEFIVTKKANGEFSVSQKNSGGNFVGIKDAASRKKAIDLFNKIKESRDKNRLKQAQELATEFNKEQSDKILSALDKAIAATSTKGRAYDATLGLPLMAANTVLKIVRAAYKGGKSLVEAIKDGHSFLKKEGYLNISEYDLKKYVLENISKKTEPKPSEKPQPPSGGKGYDNLKKTVDEDVSKGKKIDEVLSRVQKSDAYKKLNDTDKEDITRYIKKAFGEKTKSAPSAKRILGFLKDVKKVTMDELALVKKQIKDTAKGAKDAATAIKKATAELGSEINDMVSKGKITAKQAANIIEKFGKVKVLNAESVTKFTDYMRKVFADANYKEKLSDANTLKKAIKKASKSDKYDANLVKLAKRFTRIDPSLVEDIDAYNKMASDIKEAVKGSTMKKFASTVEIKAADAYVEEMLIAQKEKLTEMMREEVNELLGVDGSKLTYEEMLDMLDVEKKDMSAQDEKIVRSAAIKLFEGYSSIIDYILKTGKDPFTGEDVDVKESKKDVVKKFMEMDLRNMDIKDAIRAVDALNNFIVNESTAKMEDTVRKYVGNEKANKLDKLNVRSKQLRIYFNKKLGRFLTDQFATQPILFEALFGGQKAAEFVEREMGVTDLKSNKSKAQAIVNKMVADYTIRFLKTKPNGQDFNTTANNVERGMLAFVSRAEIGGEQKSFNNRKSLVEQSIEKLKSGTEEQKKKAEVYQEVYDKILKDSNNAKEVKSKTNKTNADAVDYWIEKWAENYDELADVSENIHNTILGKDILYTPDKIASLGPERGLKVEQEGDFDIMGSAFIQNSGNIYKKKTGRLMEATTEDKLPSNRFVDLSFDSNNANLMMDAMIDVKTAGDVRQVDAFLKSDAFQKIVPNAEERTLLQRRIDLMVRNFRNKNHYNYDEMAKLSKSLNRIASLGASYALGGLGQPFKQVIPVAINTMANGGIPKFEILFDRVKRDFINNSGEAIAMRGTESVSEFKNVDVLLEKAAESTPEKAIQYIEKASEIYLKAFLQKPDAYIAKASWLAYYEKSLKKQGVETKDIDYNTHKLNKEAAQYATRMVDRQQNISDADLKGKVFSNKDGVSQITTKVILPFASFRINQWLRMNNDLGVLTSKTATKEDKEAAGKSLAGFGVEVAAFNAIGAGLSYLTYGIATSILRGATESDLSDEDEEKLKEKDEKYFKNLMKGKASSVIQDVFSPIPVTDPLFEWSIYTALNTIQKLQGVDEKERVNIFSPKPQESYIKTFGTLGIVGERLINLYDISNALATGKIQEESFGETTDKNIRSRDEDVLGPLTTLATLNLFGVLPTEFNSAQNTIFKEIKKQASTKTEEEIIEGEEKKKANKEKNLQKISEIDKAISKSKDRAVIDELEKMRKKVQDNIEKPELTDVEEEILSEEKEKQNVEYQKLLGGYDNRSDLKKRNPKLYEKNFGEDSDYYKSKKDEIKAKELYKDAKEESKDKRYKDLPKSKSKSKSKSRSRTRNSDGSFKRVSRISSYYERRSSK